MDSHVQFSPLRPDTFSKLLTSCAEAAGLDGIPTYVLREFAAELQRFAESDNSPTTPFSWSFNFGECKTPKYGALRSSKNDSVSPTDLSTHPDYLLIFELLKLFDLSFLAAASGFTFLVVGNPQRNPQKATFWNISPRARDLLNGLIMRSQNSQRVVNEFKNFGVPEPVVEALLVFLNGTDGVTVQHDLADISEGIATIAGVKHTYVNVYDVLTYLLDLLPFNIINMLDSNGLTKEAIAARRVSAPDLGVLAYKAPNSPYSLPMLKRRFRGLDVDSSRLAVIVDLEAVEPYIVTRLLSALDRLHRSWGGGGLELESVEIGSDEHAVVRA